MPEELGRVIRIQWRQRQDFLPGNAQHFARGDEKLRQRRAVEPGTQGGLRQRRHLLEVVQHDEAAPTAGNGLGDLLQRLATAKGQFKALGHGEVNALQRTCCREIAEPRAAWVVHQQTPGGMH